MTLMPVTRISDEVACAANSGAGWWIARRSVTFSGVPSSTGSPTTFRMRPSVTSPTGTVIGPPVSLSRATGARSLVQRFTLV